MSPKRTIDVAVALFGLVVTAPIAAAAAVGTWITNGRPAIFRQVRVGLHGQTFTILKFRTMRSSGTTTTDFAPGDSSRVTALGAWLRATKIDELPQLVNVLRGEMSIVGPRPEVARWVAAYPDRFDRVLSVRPGITDPASVVFRHEERILAESRDPESTYRDEILPRKLDLYEDYVTTWSLRGDLGIVLATLRVIVTKEP